MEPTLRAGDLLLIWWGATAQQGDLVVFPHPDHPDVLTVKRIAYPDPEDPTRWWVERDNPAIGSDSWSFGSVSRNDILARVLTPLPTRRASG